MKNSRTDRVQLPELLAPAGSIAGLKAVISAGADAVYIGGSRFGARAYADNPEEDRLTDAIDYAHLRGVKVYLTVNTLLKEQELSELYEYLLPYYRAGIDAVLVQDLGVLTYIRRHFPDMPVHASTQMTVTGPEIGKLLASLGVTRLVPAREMTLDELTSIKKESGLEIETFVHGALCCCYSGQCLYSSLIGGRSGNRGRCAQPCRLLYLMNDSTYDGKTSIMEQKAARHFLSPKDLCTIDLIPEFCRAGIASLKIEGRMKQPEYAAGVVSVYRKYLDIYAKNPASYYVAEEDRQILWDLYNRSGFTDGYFHRHNGPEMMAYVKHELTREETDDRHRLYEKMHELYIEQEKKVTADLTVSVYRDAPICLTAETNGISVEVLGNAAQKAVRQPLSRERISESISKTGGSDYRIGELNVFTDEESFVPVRELNELRRQGIEALSAELLKSYRRNSELEPEPAADRSEKQDILSTGELSLSVLVSTEDQLRCAVSFERADELIIESSLLYEDPEPLQRAAESIRFVKQEGKHCLIALPYVERNQYGASLLREHLEELVKAGLDTFLIRCPETMAWFIQHGFAKYARADAGLYSWNNEAKGFLLRYGIERDTAPVELNRKELFGRNNTASDLIVYGYLPLMVTVQCLQKGTRGCDHCYQTYSLTDRMGARFQAKCDCSFCYNIVRNSVPLMLLGELDQISRMGFDRIRLQFTDESRAQMQEVLSMAQQAVSGEHVELGNRTKGHFLRGVE